jgi:hypothetical protein
LAWLRVVHMFGHNFIYTSLLCKSSHPEIYCGYIVECDPVFSV